jgi:hypothetical protein
MNNLDKGSIKIQISNLKQCSLMKSRSETLQAVENP